MSVEKKLKMFGAKKLFVITYYLLPIVQKIFLNISEQLIGNSE